MPPHFHVENEGIACDDQELWRSFNGVPLFVPGRKKTGFKDPLFYCVATLGSAPAALLRARLCDDSNLVAGDAAEAKRILNLNVYTRNWLRELKAFETAYDAGFKFLRINR